MLPCAPGWTLPGASRFRFGADHLIGGPGNDVFLFRLPHVPFSATPDTGVGEGNRDIVHDFVPGEDRLDLTGYDEPGRFFYRRADPDQLPDPIFLGTDPFVASHALQVRYEVQGERTIVQFATPLGAYAPEGPAEVPPEGPTGEIELIGVFALTAQDFRLDYAFG